MLIDGLGLCGLLWCFYQLFDGTHSLHRIHWWVSDVMLNFSKYVLLKKQNSSWMYWERVNCQQMLISGWTIRLTANFESVLKFDSRGGRVPAVPNDLVARGAERGTATGVGGVLLCCLHDGAAVLHGSGLDRFLMLRHHRAGLVWMVTVCETGIHHPWRPAGWTGICWCFSWR